MPKVRLNDALNEYERWNVGRGVQPGTIKGYKESVQQLVRLVGNIYCENVTPQHMDQYFTAYPWSASTRNKRLAQINAFLSWCRSRKYMGRDSDITHGFTRLRPEQRERLYIPVHEWSRLFDACIHPTEKFAIGAGLFLMLRGSELAGREKVAPGQWRYFGLQVKDLRFHSDTVLVTRKKVRQIDELPMSAELRTIAEEYLEWYSAQVPIQPDHYLVPARNLDHDRDPVTGRLIPGTGTFNPNKPVDRPHRIIHRVLARAGYPTRMEGEHTLRRSSARALFDELTTKQNYDGSLRLVSSFLGHRSVTVTEQYLSLDIDRQNRNALVAGQFMFSALAPADNVVPLRQEA